MDETLPMFYDGSMQNIKEHTANFDVVDFEPEANEHSCPSCAVGPSLHGDRVGERAAGHAGGCAVDRAAGHAGDCGDSQAARCVESQTRCYAGAQEEGRAEDRVGRRVGGRADDRAEDRAEKDDGNCVGGHSEVCAEGCAGVRAGGRLTIAPRFVPGVGPTVVHRALPIRNSMLPARKTSPVL